MLVYQQSIGMYGFGAPAYKLRQKSRTQFEPHPECLSTLMDMGFSEEQATQALQMMGNDLEAALLWLFEHPTPDPPPTSTIPAQSEPVSAAAVEELKLALLEAEQAGAPQEELEERRAIIAALSPARRQDISAQEEEPNVVEKALGGDPSEEDELGRTLSGDKPVSSKDLKVIEGEFPMWDPSEQHSPLSEASLAEMEQLAAVWRNRLCIRDSTEDALEEKPGNGAMARTLSRPRANSEAAAQQSEAEAGFMGRTASAPAQLPSMKHREWVSLWKDAHSHWT